MTRTIDHRVTVADGRVQKPNGPAMAALLASGIGVAALGILTTIAEASASFAKLLTINPGVGPLSGKTTYSVAAFFASWLVLGLVLRGKNVAERTYLKATLILIGIGMLGTFPIFWEPFLPK